MQVVVEKINNTERRLTIQVPEMEVTNAIISELNQLQKNVKLKGFRNGKAPMSFIRKQFFNDAKAKALGEVIKKTMYQAISDHQLYPINQPHVEPKELIEGSPLEYVVSFEILPEVTEIKFEIEKIEKPKVDIKDEDYTRVIDQLLKQQSKWNVVDRGAKEKDRVVIDYYAIFEGKSDEANTVKSYPIELGAKTMIPGFEDALIGSKAGDERKLSLTFPKDIKDEVKAGKPVEFVVTVKEILEAEIPALNEDFIQSLGVKSGKEEDLKEQVFKTLTQEKERLINEKLKEQVFSALISQNEIEVPSSLIKKEAKKIHDEIYQSAHNHDHSTEELSNFDQIAKKRVALGLLISHYAKLMNIHPDQEKINKKIEEIASLYETPSEVIAHFKSKGQQAGLEAQVLEDQVLEKLMEGKTLVEKEMTYAELKGT